MRSFANEAVEANLEILDCKFTRMKLYALVKFRRTLMNTSLAIFENSFRHTTTRDSFCSIILNKE